MNPEVNKMKKQLIFIILFFLTKYTLAVCPGCNETQHCNTRTCSCFSDSSNGFWNSTLNPYICDTCQFNYKIESGCKECKQNWNPQKQCNECINNYDHTQNCLKCKPNYDEFTQCQKCVNNYDPSKQCSVCLPGFNPATQCKECLPGKFGPTCSTTCDDVTTCHGNGKCGVLGCICNNDSKLGHWNPGTNCSTCLPGFREETKCILGSCKTNCSFSLSGFERGTCVAPEKCECSSFFVGDQCEENICYGFREKDSRVCSGAGTCEKFNYCKCNEGFRGRDCSDIVRAETLWVGLIVLFSLAIFTVVATFIVIAIIFSRQTQVRGKDGSWAQLNEDEIVDSNALGIDEE